MRGHDRLYLRLLLHISLLVERQSVSWCAEARAPDRGKEVNQRRGRSQLAIMQGYCASSSMLNASSAPCANFEMMQMLSAAKSSAEREKY